MEIEFTFILPCLNEEKSLLYCIEEIKKCICNNNLNAEILLSDNGSTDNSVDIAKRHGVRVVVCNEKGYGNVLINGMKHARGKYCIIGDSDGSYDFCNIEDFIEGVRNGFDLVVGNRYKGGIQKNAMSISHRFGSKFLSVFANVLFHTPIKDYHCGLRAYNRKSIEKINLVQSGMEYASEMIVVSKINNLKMKEVPTILRKDLRNGKSHLNTIRDGYRHLNLIVKLYMG